MHHAKRTLTICFWKCLLLVQQDVKGVYAFITFSCICPDLPISQPDLQVLLLCNPFTAVCCPKQMKKESSKICSCSFCDALAPDGAAAEDEAAESLRPTIASAGDSAKLGRICSGKKLLLSFV